MLCSIAFMISCSNDTETTSAPQNQENVTTTTAARPLPPIENATDAMFHAYVTSANYELSQSLMDQFVDDLNLTETVHFSNRGQLLSWIGSNLSSTNFVSVDQADLRWAEIETVNQNLAIEFSNVFDFIASGEISSVKYYLGKWLNYYETFGDPCYPGYRNCTDAADAQFIADVQNEKSLGGNDYSCADTNHKVAMKLCDMKLADCHKKNQ